VFFFRHSWSDICSIISGLVYLFHAAGQALLPFYLAKYFFHHNWSITSSFKDCHVVTLFHQVEYKIIIFLGRVLDGMHN